MAKKKKKTFEKSQLLSLFESGNYQKVISKIKQFSITNISSEELERVELESYEKLAESHFKSGDINRAIRDIESLLAKDSSEKNRVIKLKYLCYMGNFQLAVEFAKDLITSTNREIKRDAIFFYLLANLYNNSNYIIEIDYLKYLTVTKKNYILAMIELFNNDISKTLEILDLCRPKDRVEKENVQAIKSILSQEKIASSDSIKVVYRFLLFGDTTNLQNTKAVRDVKKDILLQFSQEKKSDDIKNLLALKSFIPMKSIFEYTSDRELQSKLIYNNIILLLKKQNNEEEALNLFVKYRNDLVNNIESANLFMQLKRAVEDSKSDTILLPFFYKYFSLHHKKLASFQKDFIFIYLFNKENTQVTKELLMKYGGESVLFLMDTFIYMDKYEKENQLKLNSIVKKHSLLYAQLFDHYCDLIESIDSIYDDLDNENRELAINKIVVFLEIMKNIERPHKKYKSVFMKLLSQVVKYIQNYSYDKNREVYSLASQAVDTFIEYYQIDKFELSEDIKNLHLSIKKAKSVRAKKEPDEENIFDMMKRVLNGADKEALETLFDDDEYYYDEEDDGDLEEIKEEFIESMKNKEWIYKELEPIKIVPHLVFDFILEILSESVKNRMYTPEFVDYILYDFLDVDVESAPHRDIVVRDILEYAKVDIEVASLFFAHIIISVEKKRRESLWYIKWLEAYVSMVDDYSLEKGTLYKSAIGHFMRVQLKKKYKALSGIKERRMRERYKKLETAK